MLYPAISVFGTDTGVPSPSDIPGDIILENATTGPVTNAVAEYKFDDGFY